MALAINIRTIPHKNQRYNTVGDWQTQEEGFGQESIVVSDMNNKDYEILVAVHELVEMILCQRNGIGPEVVTEFDKMYDSDHFDEPGDDPRAPYHNEHIFASAIEKKLAHFMGVDWGEYERAVNGLTMEKEDDHN